LAGNNDSQNSQRLERFSGLLQGLVDGQMSVEDAAQRLAAEIDAHTYATTDAQVDLDRSRRCGFPEVIYSEGKTVDAVVAIMEALTARGEHALATRVSLEQAEALKRKFPAAIHNALGRTVRVMPAREPINVGTVAVVTAGTSDRPVAEEAVETLRWMECKVDLIVDIGVAGPKRLLSQKHRFDACDAVVVIAGMEGALPSVVGGWVSCPVIAVPTSVGYGANFGGIAALLGMLNSCASNVCVVNIDSGFKGAYVAGLIARRAEQRQLDD
jgi:pyridinium-3,5-biscarboxylic acid mononucleotide synthase